MSDSFASINAFSFSALGFEGEKGEILVKMEGEVNQYHKVPKRLTFLDFFSHFCIKVPSFFEVD